jgi:hypothetical protein
MAKTHTLSEPRSISLFQTSAQKQVESRAQHQLMELQKALSRCGSH